MAIISVAEVVEYLNKTETPELVLVTAAINELIPDLCGVIFDSDTYTEKIFLRYPNLILRLKNFPVTTLTSLDNQFGTAITPLVEDFANGILRLDSDYWDDVTVITDEFDVVYTAGYLDDYMLKQLKIAALAIIQDRLEMPDTSLTKQRLSDRTFERKQALPPLAQRIIDRFTEII